MDIKVDLNQKKAKTPCNLLIRVYNTRTDLTIYVSLFG